MTRLVVWKAHVFVFLMRNGESYADVDSDALS